MSTSSTAVAAPTPGAIKSVYAHLDCLIEGIDALKTSGIKDFIVMSPLPRHDIEELIYEGRPSPIRWYTMVGAIFGGFGGFMVCSMTHLNWPMIIPAGKPLVSVPAFMILTFESTILWGCFATLFGMLKYCRLPSHDLQIETTDPRFSDDHFGLVVNNCTEETAGKIRAILTDTGAIEVTGMEATDA